MGPAPQRKGKFYKTKMCKFYQAGACTRGYECIYAHSMEEMHNLPDLHKTKLCTHFAFKGFCFNGDACVYAHGNQELRQALEEIEHPSRTQERHCRADDDSSRDCGRVMYQAVHPFLGVPIIVEPVPMMGSSHLRGQHMQTRHAPLENAYEKLTLSLAHVHAQRQQHYQVWAKMRSVDANHRQNTRNSDESASYIQDLTEQNMETMEDESCKENCGGKDDVGLHAKLEEADAFCDQACNIESEVQLFCDDDINEKPGLQRGQDIQRFWSRQTTAESSATSSLLFDSNLVCQHTSACPQTDEENPDGVLCVKNTFLEVMPALCTASIRSKSSDGRIGLSI